MYLLNGATFGLVLAVLIGPVFFTLVQTSIEKGFNKAFLVAIGISLSDIFYIFLAYMGFSQFIKTSGYNVYIGYLGGILLVLFGLYNYSKKPRLAPSGKVHIEAQGFYRFIFRGFVINGMSPFVLVFWLGAMSLATVEYRYEGHEIILFFTSTVTIVFTSDCLKAYLATRLRRLITTRFMRVLNITAGTALILFGLRMLIDPSGDLGGY